MRMTINAIKNILDFAEGGAIQTLVVSGERLSFFKEKSHGAREYSLNEEDGILQISDQCGTLFANVENINAIQITL